MSSRSIRFAQLARQLGVVAREHGLEPPAFRSPPRVPGALRSIKRNRDGSCTVSVALRGRPAVAVVADMIDGVVAANRPAGNREGPAGRPGSGGGVRGQGSGLGPLRPCGQGAANRGAGSALGPLLCPT